MAAIMESLKGDRQTIWPSLLIYWKAGEEHGRSEKGRGVGGRSGVSGGCHLKRSWKWAFTHEYVCVCVPAVCELSANYVRMMRNTQENDLYKSRGSQFYLTMPKSIVVSGRRKSSYSGTYGLRFAIMKNHV